MGTLHHHPFLIRYQGGAGDHVVQIRAGRTIRSGVGQSFWLRAGRCALAEVPTANRAHSFLVQATTSDQQNRSPSPTTSRMPKPPPLTTTSGSTRARPGRTPRACGRSTKPSPASLSPPWPRRLGR